MIAPLLFATLAFGAEPVGDTGFRRYTTGQTTFYLSGQGGRALPLVLFVQGTGCASHFAEEGGHVVGGVQMVLSEAVRGRAIVMAVEKPGVRYLDNSATCRPEYTAQYTLDRWTAVLGQALAAARRMNGVDRSRMLVVGHSEGAIVAVHLSNAARGVTHVAALSGGGPVYLFHMAEFFRAKGMDPEKELYPCWSRILKDPASTTGFCWGQTHRLWSSFMKTSILQEALASKSALYFAHGSADQQNPVSAFDVLRAELAAKGRTAVFDRVEGAGHGFDLPGQAPPAGFQAVFARILAWFER